MKLAIITPIPYLEESIKITNTHMVLGHLLKNEKYRNFYFNLKNKQSDAFVICDNSANEGHMIKDMELINLATSVKANEIIAPDKYQDALTTLSETNKFLDTYYESHIKDKFSVMAVPQGKTIDDYMMCYNAFIKDSRINTIGIGYRCLIPAVADDMFLMGVDELGSTLKVGNIQILSSKLEDNCFNYTLSRLYFLMCLADYRKLKKYNKKIHLLGLYNPYELKLINNALTKKRLEYIRSCDSAAPWQAAQANIIFDTDFGVTIKPKAFLDFEQTIDNNQLDLFKYNLDLLATWGKHE